MIKAEAEGLIFTRNPVEDPIGAVCEIAIDCLRANRIYHSDDKAALTLAASASRRLCRASPPPRPRLRLAWSPPQEAVKASLNMFRCLLMADGSFYPYIGSQHITASKPIVTYILYKTGTAWPTQALADQWAEEIKIINLNSQEERKKHGAIREMRQVWSMPAKDAHRMTWCDMQVLTARRL
jgi:hypothetical protein